VPAAPDPDEVTDAEGTVAERDGRPLADQELVIGDGADIVVSEPGYLWAYANDAWGAYGNNRGAVTLTVRGVLPPSEQPVVG
jgi:hypothetical protein